MREKCPWACVVCWGCLGMCVDTKNSPGISVISNVASLPKTKKKRRRRNSCWGCVTKTTAQIQATPKNVFSSQFYSHPPSSRYFIRKYFSLVFHRISIISTLSAGAFFSPFLYRFTNLMKYVSCGEWIWNNRTSKKGAWIISVSAVMHETRRMAEKKLENENRNPHENY